MRILKAVYFGALILIFAHHSATAESDKDIDWLVTKLIDAHQEELIRIRHYLHMNPELSNREFETSKLVASKLTSLGLEVQKGVAKTGVVAILRGNEPGITVGFRADMDALPIQELSNIPYKSLNPGIMHACGHDIHTSIALGTAVVLNSLKHRIKGNIKFIFQPAEEGPPPGEEGGARLMIAEGVLDNPSVKAILGLHVWPVNLGEALFAPGPIMASSDWFRISIKGKSAHGARPHEGVDAIAIASQIVVSLQSIISRALSPTDPAVMTIGKIYGGTRANIIADSVELEGTVRTLSEKNRRTVPRWMENIAKGITHSFGADYEFEYRPGAPPVYNHPELARFMMPTLIRVLGKAHVLELNPQMVAEDFAYFSQKVPGFFFFLGVKDPSTPSMAPLHSPYFNPDDRAIPVGVRIVCHLLLDFFKNENLFEEPEH